MIEIPKSTKGQILISNSSIVHDFFHKTVVLMVDHDETGAFGLVLNKPSGFNLLQLIQNLPKTHHAENPVFCGGPVDEHFISVLHEKRDIADPGLEVLPGVFIARTYEALLEILDSKDSQFRIIQGYAGWSSGQLESEFQKLSWVLSEANSSLVFNSLPSEDLWKEALRIKGGIYKYFVEHTKDPLLN